MCALMYGKVLKDGGLHDALMECRKRQAVRGQNIIVTILAIADNCIEN